MSKIAILNEFGIEAIKDALQKLESFPNLKVNGLNAHQLSQLEAIDPVLFAEISDQIKKGRWFPYAGTWCGNDELSEIALIKSCLYSVRYFLDKFGKKYRVFHGQKLYNNMLPQIVYSSLFDAVVLKSETESKWLHGADNFRTLVMTGDTVDVNDLDDGDISAEDFISYEDLADNFFNAQLDLEVVSLQNTSINPEGLEKALVDAEKYATIGGKDETIGIKEAWIAYFNGDCDTARKIVDGIMNGLSTAENDFKLSGDSVALTEVKLAEDGSGDTVIRVAETSGKEQSAYIMCDRLDTGFRFELMPYEMPTFRIPKNSDGYAKEIYICE